MEIWIINCLDWSRGHQNIMRWYFRSGFKLQNIYSPSLHSPWFLIIYNSPFLLLLTDPFNSIPFFSSLALYFQWSYHVLLLSVMYTLLCFAQIDSQLTPYIKCSEKDKAVEERERAKLTVQVVSDLRLQHCRTGIGLQFPWSLHKSLSKLVYILTRYI